MARGFAGLILAGGAGTRFGGPKAFARLPDGETFLSRCTAVLRASGAAPILATLPANTAAPGVSGLELLLLPAAGLEMLDSLKFGLERLLGWAWSAVVLLPVDHPLVSPSTVRALLAAGGEAALPIYRGKRGHPVCLARPVAEGIVGGTLPGRTLRDVLQLVSRVEVAVEDSGVLANCNTPERLRAALGARAR